jgi:malonyl-CoA O-methyltransferase
MELKKQIINCFNSGAYTYNAAADIQQIVALRLAEQLASVNANTVLEMGCGTGLFSQYVLASFPQAKICLMDIAPLMVQVCQQRFSAYPNIVTECQDGETFLTSDHYDLIVSSMTLHWFTDFYTSLKKLMDKLNSSGKCIFAMLGENSLSEWRAVCQIDSACHPTPKFPAVAAIKNAFPDLELSVEVTRIAYSDTYQFLKTLKLLGATAADINHITLSSGRLRKLMRALDQTQEGKIDISYEIIYGSYTKP